MHDISTFKQLAQLKDEFVHTVSHDLRSPLTSILGYVQVAQLRTIPKAQYVDVLERIETAAWRMSNLINDLLDLAALEAGVVHDAEPVALDLLVRAAIEELDGAAMAKNITIKYESNPEPMVRVDPRLMTQVWRNLIGNAIKYTPKGTVTIEVEATDELAVGRVIDTGMGIGQSDIPYIFDKFYRAKKPYSQGVEGTGLGLALVKSIVERHDGRVWVESELGVGSAFTFMLPLCQENSSSSTAD
jgi:two-component system NtrC family sensor kinase